LLGTLGESVLYPSQRPVDPEDFMFFRLSLLSVVTLVSFVWLPVSEAMAQNGAWCSRRQGSMSCGFATFQQCMATVLGDGGICVENPAGGARGAVGGPPGGPATAAKAKKDAAERQERAREAAEAKRAKQKEEAARRQRAKQQDAAKPAPAAAPAPSATAPSASVPAAAMTGGASVGELDVNAVPVLNREAIRRVQTVLKEKGFDPGPLNGVATPRTQEAVKAFQTRYGIEARGTIDNQTLLALGEGGLASQGAR
jgi:hypothetical protein